MAKKTAGESYTLRLGRTQPFRRTVNVGKKSVQLVFEPGVDIELSDEEVKQCQDLIDIAMIVPADRDDKGRLRMPREVVEQHEAETAELQATIDAQNAKIAALESQLAAKGE